MKVKDVMTSKVIRIAAEEKVEVAARMLAHYNIGVLPVCGDNGRLRGLVTDRDIVTRCLASGRSPRQTAVGDIMSMNLVCVTPEMDVSRAAQLMGSCQIRRLPVMEEGKLCGMVSLGDLAGYENAVNTLNAISSNISSRK